jgi:hypothetical protein
MRHIKSERLKKLEAELNDLQQWLKLGLVPKKDTEKHKEEIHALQLKIDEEKERLQFLKESGETEEFTAPKRPQGRANYTEMPTIPDIDIPEGAGALNDTNFDMDTEAVEADGSDGDDEKEDDDGDEEESEDESYFSDRNRWRRGGIIDPDADEW